MAAQKGSLFLVGIGDGGGPEAFTNIGSARSTSMSLNNETVDVTAKDSSGWRELLAGAGVTSMSISLSGVFKDSAGEEAVRLAAFNSSIDNWELSSGNGDTFLGAFQITSYERTGEYNGEETFSVSLESAGVVVATLA